MELLPATIRSILDPAAEPRPVSERVALLASALSRLLERAPAPAAEIRLAIRQIAHDPRVTLREIADHLGWRLAPSAALFRRHRTWPQNTAANLRIQRLLDLPPHPGRASSGLSRLAFRAGFADQAHGSGSPGIGWNHAPQLLARPGSALAMSDPFNRAAV